MSHCKPDNMALHGYETGDMTSQNTLNSTNENITDLSANFSDNLLTTPRPLPTIDPWFNTVRFICEVCISLPIATLGIIGNVIAFIVLCRQKQRVTTNILLQALAVADTLVLISAILLRSLRYVRWEAYLKYVFPYMFVGLYPCVYVFRLADTWLTVMLTIDRYIAVCHPLHAQRLCTLKRTYIAIAVITLATLLFCLPRFFEYRIMVIGSQVGYMHTDLVKDWYYVMVYRVTLFFVVMYLLPMIVLIVLNVRLMCTLRRTYTTRNSMISDGILHNGHGARMVQRDSRGVTIIVAAVVIVCVLCNVTATTAHVLFGLQMSSKSMLYVLDYTRRYLANVNNVMVTFNCAVNFLIYCVFSRKFRSGLSQTCNCEGVRRLGRRWRSDHYSDSSGAVNSTSYTSVGHMSLRASQKSIKKNTLTSNHKLNTDC